jgi:hypothetical protein
MMKLLLCALAAVSVQGITVTTGSSSKFSGFAGEYNQTYPAGKGPGDHGGFQQIVPAGGKSIGLYFGQKEKPGVTNFTGYWTFCPNFGEPADICAEHGPGVPAGVVVGHDSIDDPTKVTAWQSLAPDGFTLTPLPDFKVTA